MEQLAPGSLIGGRYRLVEWRATGASANVWLAHDELLDCRVAAKISLDDVVIDGRPTPELHIIAALDHPGLTTVHDTVTVGTSLKAQILEWVDGTDLRSLLDSGPLPINLVESLANQLADALDALHCAGLIHRDVKPANIMLERDGCTKLIDFDLAIVAGRGASPMGDIVGTAKYMSPEQVRGHELDARSDTFSLCVVLYEALTGEPPFTGDSEFDIAMARFDHSPPDPRGVRPETPANIADLIMQGLSIDPADRWTHITRPSRMPPVVTTRQRVWPLLFGIAAAVAIAALGLGLVLSGALGLTG